MANTDQEENVTPVEEEEKVEPQEEQDVEQQSEETEQPVEETKEEEYDVVKGLQKGYTQTRQELADIKKSIDDLKQVQQPIGEQPLGEPTTPAQPSQEPTTWSEAQERLLNEMESREQRKAAEQEAISSQIDQEVEELKLNGVIKNDEEAEKLFQFTIDLSKDLGYIPSIKSSANVWQKVREAENKGQEEGLKTGVKQDEGSKIGKSSKATTTEESSKPSYDEIHNSDMFSL